MVTSQSSEHFQVSSIIDAHGTNILPSVEFSAMTKSGTVIDSSFDSKEQNKSLTLCLSVLLNFTFKGTSSPATQNTNGGGSITIKKSKAFGSSLISSYSVERLSQVPENYTMPADIFKDSKTKALTYRIRSTRTQIISEPCYISKTRTKNGHAPASLKYLENSIGTRLTSEGTNSESNIVTGEYGSSNIMGATITDFILNTLTEKVLIASQSASSRALPSGPISYNGVGSIISIHSVLFTVCGILTLFSLI